MKTFTAVSGFRDEEHGRVQVVDDGPNGGLRTMRRAKPLKIRSQYGANGPKSPDGHAWGYAGSGPAQLAMDILWELYGREPSAVLLQTFKVGVIARLNQDDGFRITEEEVRLFVDGAGGFEERVR
jgi:hypothetical protein